MNKINMGNICLSVIFFFAFFLSSCASPEIRRQRFVTAHPKSERNINNAVLRGSIFEGMSAQAVKASWGKAQRKYRRLFGRVPAVHWEYDIHQPDRIDTYMLIFRKGFLVKMKLKHSKPISNQ